MCVDTCVKNAEDHIGSDGNDLALYTRALFSFVLAVQEWEWIALGCCFIEKQAHCPRELMVNIGFMRLCLSKAVKFSYIYITFLICHQQQAINNLRSIVGLFIWSHICYVVSDLDAWLSIACIHVQNIIVCDE